MNYTWQRELLTTAQTNSLFQNTAIGKLDMAKNQETRSFGQRVLFMSAESVRIMAILLQPFMPDRMKAALDLMVVDETKRTFEYAQFRADLDYGPPALPADTKPTADVIFPMLLSPH